MRRLAHVEKLFPALAATHYEKHSSKTDHYNCFAFAIGDCLHWWDHNSCWPIGVLRGESINDAIAAYQSQRFVICTNDTPERGFEKVAIYGILGQWTHFARLRPDGWWESKIGELEDIIHSATADLAGKEYGTVCAVMKRTLTDRAIMCAVYRQIPPQGLSLSVI